MSVGPLGGPKSKQNQLGTKTVAWKHKISWKLFLLLGWRQDFVYARVVLAVCVGYGVLPNSLVEHNAR